MRTELGEEKKDLVNEVSITNRLCYDNDEEEALKTLKEGISSLLETMEVPKVFTWGFGKLFDVVLGTKDSTQTVLENISQSLDSINSKLDNLIKQILDLGYGMQIQDYINYSQKMSIVNSTYLAELQAVDAMLDGDTKAQQQVKLIQDMNYDDFYTEVLLLGNKLIEISAITGFNLFTAFDKLAVNTYKWEHQGYEPRALFRNGALGLYLSLASFCEIAIQGTLKDIDKTQVAEIAKLNNFHNSLLTQVDEVNKMVADTSIIKRGDDVRYYQVMGHERLISSVPQRMSVPPISYNQIENKYLMSFIVTSNGNHVPNQAWYQAVRNDYGNNKTLFSIFFSSEEGNLYNTPGFSEIDCYVLDDLYCQNEMMQSFASGAIIASDGTVNSDYKLATRETDGGRIHFWRNPNANLVGIQTINS